MGFGLAGKFRLPTSLFITELEVADDSLIYTLPEAGYPAGWMKLSFIQNQILGDGVMKEKIHLGIRVKSAINVFEYNILLNPLFPLYHDLVKVISVNEIAVDDRLAGYGKV